MAEVTSFVFSDYEDFVTMVTVNETPPTDPISYRTEVVTIDINISGGGGIKKSG